MDSEIMYWEPKTVEDYLTLISDVAIDYDGYRDPKNLMELIDEMAGYARKAIALIIEQEKNDCDGSV